MPKSHFIHLASTSQPKASPAKTQSHPTNKRKTANYHSTAYTTLQKQKKTKKEKKSKRQVSNEINTCMRARQVPKSRQGYTSRSDICTKSVENKYCENCKSCNGRCRYPTTHQTRLECTIPTHLVSSFPTMHSIQQVVHRRLHHQAPQTAQKSNPTCPQRT